MNNEQKWLHELNTKSTLPLNH